MGVYFFSLYDLSIVFFFNTFDVFLLTQRHAQNDVANAFDEQSDVDRWLQVRNGDAEK